MQTVRRMLVRVLAVAVAGFLLVACQVELYGGLTEGEANEIIALLQRNGISVDKTVGKKQVVSLLIEQDRFADAMDILSRHGLPRTRFSDLGDVFKKEGMVSSPTEEKARFLYARSQELSQTLTNIEGVLSARVHVVLPKKESPTSPLMPASASVFIRHRADEPFNVYVPKIKRLVSNSIEGLTYETVAVALFPVDFGEQTSAPALQSAMGIWVDKKSVDRFWQTITLSALLSALAGAGATVGALHLWRQRHTLLSMSTSREAA